MSSTELPEIGFHLRSSQRTVTAAEVEEFARLTGDLHPLHLDEEWAKSSLFEERIAPGMLVLSYSIALVELDPGRVVALRRLRNVVFKRPTRLNDKIHVEAVVTSSREVGPDLALVGLRWIVRNAAEQTLLRASIEVLWNTAPDNQDRPLRAPRLHEGS
jgi:3-hydroxybutyryl-CoA dehydratase